MAFLEMAGTLALLCFAVCSVVLLLLAWVRTKRVYRLIPRRFYRRSLQHSLSSQRLLARLAAWLIVIVVTLIMKSWDVARVLAIIALIADILRSSIPPVALVSSASKTSSAANVLHIVAAVTWPMRTIHFLRDDTGSVERLRTVDNYYWEEAYASFADFVPVVVIDCANVTSHLLVEATHMLNPARRWKAIFVSNESDDCPLLQRIGLVDSGDPTLTVVHERDLAGTVATRLRSWLEIHNRGQ